jgi:hypothetical protein
MTIITILKGNVSMWLFNPLNDYGRIDVELRAFLIWTLELKETPTLFWRG